MNFQAHETEKMKEYASAATNILEYGCGASTQLFSSLSNVIHIYSVESDSTWIDTLEKNNIEKVTFHYIDIGASPGSWGYPQGEGLKKNWANYSEVIYDLPSPPDLVLVDGRFRVACALKAYRVLSPTTPLLVHDYIGRSHYTSIEKFYNKDEVTGTLTRFSKKSDIDFDELDKAIEKYNNDPR